MSGDQPFAGPPQEGLHPLGGPGGAWAGGHIRGQPLRTHQGHHRRSGTAAVAVGVFHLGGQLGKGLAEFGNPHHRVKAKAVAANGLLRQQADRAATGNQGLGVFIGFFGIILVTGAFSGLSSNSWRGVIELLGATLCYGISCPYSTRYVNVLDYSPRSLAATQVSISALLLAPFALIHGITHAPWSAKSIWGILILGALGTGFAYIWNFRNVRLAGSLIASTVTFITPVVATILGIWLLHESFKFTQVIGGVCVLLSGALVQKRIKLLRIS